jgi:cell division septation protein DedD
MEEPVSWKGQTFTLLVFAGIVVLCSIFFVLGMLVGRDQGRRLAEPAVATIEPAVEPPPVEGAESYFDTTTQPNPPLDLQPEPAPPATPAAAPPPTPASNAKVEPPLRARFYLQILATRDSREADRELAKVKSKNFRALILPPKPGEKDAYDRVQVGPFETTAEADMVKKDLQAQGYKNVFRK